MKKKRIIYWSLIVALSAVIVVCVGLIAAKLIGDAQDKQEYNDLASIMESAKEEAQHTKPAAPTDPVATVPPDVKPDSPTGTTNPTAPRPTIPVSDILYEYQLLYELNTDMVGWITIEGTEINYPVVQSLYEPNFYLRRNFYKEKATCGTIYVREACNVNTPSDNVTLYGHNMRNGTMFADLHNYEDPAYWASNRFIQFNTLREYHTYEIFAVFKTSATLGEGFRYHLFETAEDPAEFDAFVSECKRLSYYDTGITPQYGEKLLTLSTCDKSIDNGRMVVVARRLY